MTEGVIITLIGVASAAIGSLATRYFNKESNALELYKEYDQLKNDKIEELTEAVKSLSEQVKSSNEESKKKDEAYRLNQIKMEVKINKLADIVIAKACWRDPCNDPEGPKHIDDSQLTSLVGDVNIQGHEKDNGITTEHPVK